MIIKFGQQFQLLERTPWVTFTGVDDAITTWLLDLDKSPFSSYECTTIIRF